MLGPKDPVPGPPGGGGFDLTAMFRDLDSQGYAGWVAAEPPTSPGGAMPPSTDIRRPLATPPTAEITDPILFEMLSTLLAERTAERIVGPGRVEAIPNPDASADHDDTLSTSEREALLELLPLPPSALVPAHGDPTPANMLFDGVAVTLIDWEYAAMAHPLWDFAGLAVEAALPKEVEIAMLAMAGARPTRGYVGLKFAALAVSGLWAALRDESALPDHPIRHLRDERLSLATVLADRILAAGA